MVFTIKNSFIDCLLKQFLNKLIFLFNRISLPRIWFLFIQMFPFPASARYVALRKARIS